MQNLRRETRSSKANEDNASVIRYYLSLPLRKQGVTIYGPSKSASLGSSVSFIGDFNGDGNDDIVIGADGMYNQLGGAYVIFGGPELTEIDLAHLTPSRGFHLMNIVPKHDETKKYDDDDKLAGVIVTGLGDINGDNLADFAIASVNCVFVIYGTKQIQNKPIDLSKLHSENNKDIGFVIRSPGANVVRVGDVNGDGLDDIYVASSNANFIAAIVFGRSERLHEDIALDGSREQKEENTNKNTPAYTVITKPHSSSFHHQIAGIGDVNGDHLQDFAVASYDLSCVFILYGSKSMQSVINLNFIQVSRGNQGEFKAAIENSHGFAVYGGLGSSPNFGAFIGGGGDVNGDGVSDIVIGCSGCQYNDNQGLSFLIYGSATEDRDKLFYDLRDGQEVPLSYNIFHTPSVKDMNFIGDVNGDTLDDMVIVGYGSSQSNRTTAGTSAPVMSNGHHDGEPIILFGQREFPFYLNTEGLISGKLPGIVTAGDRHHDYTASSIDRFGHGGDFNGDGYADILIGHAIYTPYDNSQRMEAGVVQIVYGFGDDMIKSSHTPSSTSRILVMASPLLIMLIYILIMAAKHFRVNEFMMSHYKAAFSMRSKTKYQPVATNDEEGESLGVIDDDEELTEQDEGHYVDGVEMVPVRNRSSNSIARDQSMILDKEGDD